MLSHPAEKYRPYPPIALPDRRWPDVYKRQLLGGAARARRLAAGGNAARAAHDRQRGGAHPVYRSAGARRSSGGLSLIHICS